MRKRLTFLMTAALLLLCGFTWAQQTVTWTASEQGYENAETITSIDIDDNVAGEFFKGSNNNPPKYYNTGAAIRCYGGNYFTITSSDGNLAQIALAFGEGDSGSNAITTDVGTFSNGTWEGDAASVTFTIGGTTGHRRIAAFTVTYGGEGPAVAMPTFSPVGGTYTEAQTVTISCATDFVDIYYTTDGSDPDDESIYYEGPITVSETMTIKAIAYDANDNTSAVASATYTILTPMTIAEVRAQGTGSVWTSGTVTSCAGTTGYIQDATAAICVYGTALTVGDNITVSGNLSTYNGLLEIVSPVVTVNSNGNTIEPTVMTIEAINTDYAGDNAWQGWFVRLENVMVTNISSQNTTVSQDGNTIVVRGISGVTYSVNDYLTLDGNIGCFNAAQIANPQNVVVQSNQDPIITVTPIRVDVPCAAAEGTLNVTYQNVQTNQGVSIAWFEADGETPATYNWVTATVNEEMNIDYSISANTGEARLAYMKVVGRDAEANNVYSSLVTFSQGHYIPDFATLPFSFDEGVASIENTPGLTQNGLGSDYSNSPKLKFNDTGDWLILHFNEGPGKLTFNIKGNPSSGVWEGTFTVQTSEDGETYTDLATYTELTTSVQSESFNNLGENVRYIKWIYSNKASGNVALGNIKLLLPSSGETYNLTVAPFENLEIFTFVGGDENEPALDGAGTIQVAEGDNVMLSVSANEGYVLHSLMVDGVEHVNDITDDETYSFDMPDHDVTISATAVAEVPFTPVTYTLATSIESGRHYIVVGVDGEDAYAMGMQNNNNRAAVAITIADGVAQVNSPDVYEFVINTVGVHDYSLSDSTAMGYGNLYTIYDVANTGYLYAASSGSNYLRTETHLDANCNGMWTIEIYDSIATVTARGSNSRNLMRYNSGSHLFACYGTGQQDIYLYVKNEEAPQYDFYKDIVGYGTSEGGYRLIATPINAVADPAEVGMIASDNYDLYSFDLAQADEEWRNFKAQSFNFANRKGYLYANQNNVTLHFQGTPNPASAQVTLQYQGSSVNGWNLVGNPINTVASTNGRAFYVMNAEGTEVELAQRTYVNPMEGIFVKADAENETVTFSAWVWDETFGGFEMKLGLSVSGDNGSHDVACIRFGEGLGLEKFQLNPKHTKLYFTQNNTDYAVVHTANEGQMPVNFKPEANGTYTFNVNAENMEMQYLHLIDNLTGTDIDLLQTSSYSFESKVSDDAARFTLVFIRK